MHSSGSRLVVLVVTVVVLEVIAKEERLIEAGSVAWSKAASVSTTVTALVSRHPYRPSAKVVIIHLSHYMVHMKHRVTTLGLKCAISQCPSEHSAIH